ncbi:MAG TPA: EamA family transporter [Burkholderiaceae bacterium]
MSARDLALALFVAALWGANFSVIKLGLAGIDPYLLAALRFLLCAFPAVLFVPRPAVPVRVLAAYGVLFGVLLWGLVFAGIQAGVSAGLASLVLQAAAFFTVLAGALHFRERIAPHQILGCVCALAGIAAIFGISDGSASAAGLLLVLAGAAAWAYANLLVKRAGSGNMLAFLVWSSLAAPLPLLAIACMRIGADGVAHTMLNLNARAVGSLVFQAYVATLFGYAVWNGLLRKYALAQVAPLSLLVPVFGVATSRLVFGEALGSLKLAAMLAIVAGLAINQFGGRLPARELLRRRGS